MTAKRNEMNQKIISIKKYELRLNKGEGNIQAGKEMLKLDVGGKEVYHAKENEIFIFISKMN